mgnify:FL=1|tara:strand:+ start:50 stop:415 length:366 start_codon:yes stop_codon:yes gene_type:complete
MKNRTVYYFIGLVMFMIFLIFFVIGSTAKAGGPWNDQYCDIETTQIKVVDQQGNILEHRVEEKVTCQDGVKDFLHGFGIADSCQMFTWKMPIGETLITQRQVACHKMNGEYEIVQGYHSID